MVPVGFLSSGLVVKSPQRESTFRQLDQNSGPGDPGLLCAGSRERTECLCSHLSAPFPSDLALLFSPKEDFPPTPSRV